MPWISERQIKEVDYGTFISMTEEGKIGKVEIQQQENTILFTDEDETAVYKTAMVEDDQLTQRLYDAGISFYGEEIRQTSPVLSALLSWIIPLVIFILIGQYMSRKLTKKAGGANSMMFGMGKSNAKIYVNSTEGIKFTDVAGEDEAKENLTEIVEYLHNAERDPSCRPSGNRKNHACQGSCRGGQCSLLFYFRIRICGNVCGDGGIKGERSVQSGKGKSSLYCIH